MDGLEIFFLMVLIVIGLAGVAYQSGRLNDPDDLSTVPIEQLPDVAALDDGDLYDVAIWRQSGNIHRLGGAGVSRHEALKEITAALKRANIDAVRLEVNSSEELTVWRLIHHGRGVQEGKRIGGASIKSRASFDA